MAQNCKFCGVSVDGNKYAMAAHRRHHCAGRNGALPSIPSFSPVALIASLDADSIRQEIAATERQLKALGALLTVAEAKDWHDSADASDALLAQPAL